MNPSLYRQVEHGRGHFLGKDDSCDSTYYLLSIIYLCRHRIFIRVGRTRNNKHQPFREFFTFKTLYLFHLDQQFQRHRARDESGKCRRWFCWRGGCTSAPASPGSQSTFRSRWWSASTWTRTGSRPRIPTHSFPNISLLWGSGSAKERLMDPDPGGKK